MTETLEIITERAFPCPPDTLFAAVANPEKLALWWGPHGFENTIPAFDFTPGGTWRIVMTASDGNEFDNHWTFLAIDENRMIRARHHLPVHDFVLEMRFEDNGAGSRLVWVMELDPTDENRGMARFMKAANDQNLERLAAFLDSESAL